MAEDKEKMEDGAEDTEGQKSKGGKKKLIILAAVALVVIAGAGAGAFFMLSGGKDGEDAAAEEAGEHSSAPATEHKPAKKSGGHGSSAKSSGGHGAGGAVAGDVYYHDLPEILVNLSSTSGVNHFLKMKLTLELGSEADVPLLERVLPRIIDDFQLYLRQLRMDDLSGAQSTQRLKEALLLRANQVAQPLEIKAVLFKEFLVQ